MQVTKDDKLYGQVADGVGEEVDALFWETTPGGKASNAPVRGRRCNAGACAASPSFAS